MKGLAAFSISIFALLLAINGMFGSSNSGRILNKTIEANNLWTWYGTKNVRATIHDTVGSKEESARLKVDMEEIQVRARQSEADRDAAKNKSPWYSYAGMALQLSIVLSSAAILAVAMTLFYASLVVGGAGAVLFLVALGA